MVTYGWIGQAFLAFGEGLGSLKFVSLVDVITPVGARISFLHYYYFFEKKKFEMFSSVCKNYSTLSLIL